MTIEYPVADDMLADLDTPVVHDVELLLLAGHRDVSFVHRTGIKEFVTIKLIEGYTSPQSKAQTGSQNRAGKF